ncbi:MAG: S-layer homology domain-containing protein [Clostridiales bacterium]|nr:S-layer homology domain-containing protein [Clostridiales bacterium]
MRNFKRTLTLVLAVIFVCSVFAFSASAASKFSDVDPNNEILTNAVTLLEGIGVTKGVTETAFGTSAFVTREQMAAFIYRLMKKGASLEGGPNTTPFTDLKDDTFFGMISWANSMGIIKGVSATEFDPEGTIMLQDAYTMVVRALGYEKDAVLSYPYDYITIAESKGVELNKGLPSNLFEDYESELTRGDIAIILYNAFYAEMNEKEIKETPYRLSNGKWTLMSEEANKTLCEKIYEVEEQTFVVRETTHYAFNDSEDSSVYKPTEDANGEGTMFLEAKEGDKIPGFYTTTAELGLDGDADSYIMSEVKVFCKYNEKENKVEEILLAECKMIMYSNNSAKLGRWSRKYYNGDSEYPRATGALTVSGQTCYFYDAPYTYFTPKHIDGVSEYEARNADNAKRIDMVCLDKANHLYSFYTIDDHWQSYDETGTPDGDSAFLNAFRAIYYGGVFKIDAYDNDGDGRIEYVWFRPATVGKIVASKDYNFSKFAEYRENKPVVITPANPDAFQSLPVIYTNGADVYGVAYNDGDFVAAYISQQANYVEIQAVAAAYKGVITYISGKMQSYYVRIGNSTQISAHQIDRAFTNFYSSSNLATAILDYGNLNKTAIVYSLSGKAVYYEIIENNSSFNNADDIIIPVEEETISSFNTRTNRYDQYLKVLMDGEETYVPVNVDDCYPKPTKTVNGTYRFDVTVTEENGKTYYAYYGKPCKYEYDDDDKYILKSMFHEYAKNGKIKHISYLLPETFFDTTRTYQAAYDLGVKGNDQKVIFKKRTGKKYALVDSEDDRYSMFGTDGTSSQTSHWFNDVIIDDKTQFMFRCVYEDTDGEMTSKLETYTGADFPGTIDSVLGNVQYVYENIGDSKTQARLAFLYAEVEDDHVVFAGDKAVASSYVVIKASEPKMLGEEKYAFAYDVFDIATGTVVEGILGTKTTKDAKSLTKPVPDGAVVKVSASGEIDDKKIDVDNVNVISPVTNNNMAFVKEVVNDSEETLLEIAIVNDADTAYYYYEGYVYDVLEIAKDAHVAVITFADKEDISSATIAASSVEALAEAEDALLAFNDKYLENDDEPYSLEHNKYVKVFVTHEKKSKDEYPVVDNIIIIVNNDEPFDFLDVEANDAK